MMKPSMREHNVSMVRVPMIISSTSSPLSCMIPISIFILFFSGLIVSSVEGYDGFSLYLSSIPFMFYCFVSIIFGFLFSSGLIPDIGYIKKMESTSTKVVTGVQDDDAFLGGKEGDEDLIALILPILSLLVAIAVYFVATGMVAFTPSVLTAILVSVFYGVVKKRIKVKDISGFITEGFLSITPVMLILFVAFGFGRMVSATGFNSFVAGVLGDYFSGAVVPVVLFLVASLIAYATGSLTASAVIIFPVGLPLALATGAHIELIIGACVSGAQFGDLSSPLSDNMIMTSVGSGVNPIDTAKCLLPYRIITLIITAILFLIFGFVLTPAGV